LILLQNSEFGKVSSLGTFTSCYRRGSLHIRKVSSVRFRLSNQKLPATLGCGVPTLINQHKGGGSSHSQSALSRLYALTLRRRAARCPLPLAASALGRQGTAHPRPFSRPLSGPSCMLPKSRPDYLAVGRQWESGLPRRYWLRRDGGERPGVTVTGELGGSRGEGNGCICLRFN